MADLQPCLGDWTAYTPFDPHYFYQGAWLARKLQGAGINKHVDVGSSVLTVSVLSAYVETIFVDYRPLKTSLPGLTTISGTILNLPFADNSLQSLSCLHVIEHIGLGRYGDTLDPLGSVKAAIELQRVLRVGGSLFLSLPVGRERICFNAHRVHSPESTVKLFPLMSLIEFSYVDDAGQFLERKSVDEYINFEYGCGLFHFQKN
jgi:SAM-dependent methyltransferase